MTMTLRQYQVDAFASQPFEGNPAAVCPLDRWPDDSLLQAIANENNLSETAFFVPSGSRFELRWFTPAAEVNLCGHATLATAHVLFEHLGYSEPTVVFTTRGGELRVTRDGAHLCMDFPASHPAPCTAPRRLIDGLGVRPAATLAAEDYIAVLADEAAVRAVQPDSAALAQLDLRGVIVTAPGDNADFVSRFFAPRFGIPEDPVTGSAHCALTPYWAARLGRERLTATQVSARGGTLQCQLQGERVLLAGRAVTVMEAQWLL
jgi:PhzF family phenazine biosynthesis protein